MGTINSTVYGLATSGFLFRGWTRDASLSATDLARRRIDPPTWPGRLNQRREPGAITGVAFYFNGSCFLFNHAIG